MFGKIHHAPLLNWGVSGVLTKRRSGTCIGKFADGRAVFCGGQEDDPGFFIPSLETLVFAADGLSHVLGDPMPASMSSVESARLGDGRLLFTTNTGTTFTLEPAGLTWTVQPSASGSTNGARVVALPSGNALRVGGGGSTTIQEYKYTTDTWENRPSMANGRSFPAVVVMSNGKVLVSGGGSSVVQIYDPIAQSWSSTVNTLQAQNNGNAAIAMSNGKVMLCNSVYTGPLYTIYTDIYDPILNKFRVAASGTSSWQGASAQQTFNPLFEIGEGFVVLLAFIPQARESYYDFRANVWQERVPAYPERWKDSFVQLDKNTILSVGGFASGFVGQEGSYVLPHFPQQYVLRGSTVLNEKTAPTFGGITSVEDGNRVGKALVHWTPAAHVRTHPQDINYFLWFAPTSGGQVLDPSNPYVSTTAWAGSNTIELFNLTPGVDYYIVVRARDMVAIETSINEAPTSANFDQNTTEILYVPPSSIPAPTFNWTSTASMYEPRHQCKAIQLSTGAATATGDNGRIMIVGGITTDAQYSYTADIYSQDGLSVEPLNAVPDAVTEFAVIHANPSNGNTFGTRRAQVVGGNTNVNSSDYVSLNAARYYQYARQWFVFSFQAPPIPPMLQGVRLHGAVGANLHDILASGGLAAADNITPTGQQDASDKLQWLEVKSGTRIYYTGASGTFTVGNAISGSGSGATGTVYSVNTGSQYVEIDNEVGFFLPGDVLNDGGVTATAQSIYYSFMLQRWTYKAPMNAERFGHQAIELTDGRMMIAGGYNLQFNFPGIVPARDIELYTLSTNTWTIVYGLALAFQSQTTNFTVGNWVGGISSFCSFRIRAQTDGGAAGTLRTSHVRTADAGGDWLDDRNSNFINGETLTDANLTFTNETGSHSATTTLLGQTSGATARIAALCADDEGDSVQVWVVNNVVGTFTVGETIEIHNPFSPFVQTGTAEFVSLTGGGNGTANGTMIEYVRPHNDFPMVKLLDDKIMLVGGDVLSGADSLCDIFDPSGDTVAHAADLPNSRTHHTAHVFGSGDVGVFGGQDSTTGQATDDVQLYDPIGDSWAIQNSMLTARSHHASILLANNKVLVAGGKDISLSPLSSAEISDS